MKPTKVWVLTIEYRDLEYHSDTIATFAKKPTAELLVEAVSRAGNYTLDLEKAKQLLTKGGAYLAGGYYTARLMRHPLHYKN